MASACPPSWGRFFWANEGSPARWKLKEADQLACEAWNQRMLGYKGPAQPSPASGGAAGLPRMRTRRAAGQCIGGGSAGRGTKRHLSYPAQIAPGVCAICNTGTSQGAARNKQAPHPVAIGMKHRGVEYTVVQGIGQHIWKWSVSLDASPPTNGQAATKAQAVSEAERAINRALAPKKLRLVPPRTES
jgi:hypothetical protein